MLAYPLDLRKRTLASGLQLTINSNQGNDYWRRGKDWNMYTSLITEEQTEEVLAA